MKMRETFLGLSMAFEMRQMQTLLYKLSLTSLTEDHKQLILIARGGRYSCSIVDIKINPWVYVGTDSSRECRTPSI
jgi:hypothetical protein